MKSIVCTLFEGNYHYGLAALINSLYNQGYRGEVYAGYRGPLPFWASSAVASPELAWPGSCSLIVGAGLKLNFLPLKTDYHFTNYKPDFMLSLWDGLSNQADAIFYFDPDIVVITPWRLFDGWVGCGVALCEDVNSPVAEHHPTRTAWRRYFGSKGFTLRFKEAMYVNGGFVGVQKQDISFLTTWQALQEAMAPAIGGLNRSTFTGIESLPFAPFSKTDQDALNATIEAWVGNVSLVGKEGMAFKVGGRLMSHALGKLKPWTYKPLIGSFAGQLPRLADRDYWSSANGPILSQPAALVWRRQLGIKVAALIGRFYRRN
ncbi:hypothetical protein H8B13_20090 [Hymenobacter sp. BT188]|uniref:hypothetical protein n=1 Tax=Hymenobacter sp. BT188 TaxID=2763504 RepID=UPI0016514874|nr:hypothetical protein [Hymenobacter sp. BT188]MBC6609130.1 hypothetical protein [Hymenobacter sp. BT188]